MLRRRGRGTDDIRGALPNPAEVVYQGGAASGAAGPPPAPLLCLREARAARALPQPQGSPGRHGSFVTQTGSKLPMVFLESALTLAAARRYVGGPSAGPRSADSHRWGRK